MPGRRIARELAVIILPQLPKNKEKLERFEYAALVASAVRILTDYAKQNIADAMAFIQRSAKEIIHIEIEHPDNEENLTAIENLEPVKVNTRQLKDQLESLERTVHILSEALDIPQMALSGGYSLDSVNCKNCQAALEIPVRLDTQSEVSAFLLRLLDTFVMNRKQIDEFINKARSKWKLERMVSIDRDILRLACTEAFFMTDVPVNVAISEAVELCHRFADDKAAKFINGVLADLAQEAHWFRRTGEYLGAKTQEQEVVKSE